MTTWAHALQIFLAVCTGFTVVCVAVGWLIKIIRGIKKPADDVKDKLQRDYDKLNDHEAELKQLKNDGQYIRDAFKVLLENDKVMLEHMRTNNATGDIAKREKATFDFLNEHQP